MSAKAGDNSRTPADWIAKCAVREAGVRTGYLLWRVMSYRAVLGVNSKQFIRAACVGACYFSQFHYGNWLRIPQGQLVAACDLDLEKAAATGLRAHDDLPSMLAQKTPHLLDIILTPDGHADAIRRAGRWCGLGSLPIIRFVDLWQKRRLYCRTLGTPEPPSLSMRIFAFTGGTLTVDGLGAVGLREFGRPSSERLLAPDKWDGFGGDCIHALQQHVISGLLNGTHLENPGSDYLDVIRIEQAIYRSDAEGRRNILEAE